MKRIKQKHYLPIDIDVAEKDIVQLWAFGNDESNVILIEREMIPALIAELEKHSNLNHPEVR